MVGIARLFLFFVWGVNNFVAEVAFIGALLSEVISQKESLFTLFLSTANFLIAAVARI
jgi:hypothetical protein